MKDVASVRIFVCEASGRARCSGDRQQDACRGQARSRMVGPSEGRLERSMGIGSGSARGQANLKIEAFGYCFCGARLDEPPKPWCVLKGAHK